MIIRSALIMNLETRSIPFWIPNWQTAKPMMQISVVQNAIIGALPSMSENPAVTSSVDAPANSPEKLRKQ